MRSPIHLCFLRMPAVALCLLALPAFAFADRDVIFHALPEDRTLFAVRAPSLSGALTAMEQGTQIGEAVSRDRLMRLIHGIVEQEEQQEFGGERFRRDLGILRDRSGLDYEDLFRIFDGPAGYARVVEPRDGGGTGPGLDVFWFEPGPELAEAGWKLWEAVWELSEDGRSERVRRIDSEVRGVRMSHVLEREIGRIVPPDFWDQPRDYWEWDWDKQREFDRERREEYEALPEAERGQRNTMLARIDGAFVIVHGHYSMPEPSRFGRHQRVHFEIDPDTGDIIERVQEREPEQAPEPPTGEQLDERSGVEQATALIARFVDSASGNTPRDGFVSRAAGSAAAREAEVGGAVIIEAYADLALVMAEAAEDDDEDHFRGGPFNLPPAEMHEQLGFSDLGIGGVRITLDGATVRTGAFVNLPAPRRGIMRLIEQAEIAPQPAAWVPATAPFYAHFSFKPLDLYEAMMEIVIATEGPDFEAFIEQQEEQMKQEMGFNQRDLAASLGERHHVVVWDIDPPQESRPWDDLGTRMGLVQSLVFGVERPEPIEGIMEYTMEMMAQFDPEHPGLSREQGFVGIRNEDDEDRPSGTFVGEGHLVVAAGKGAVETTLSAIRRGDGGGDSLSAADTTASALRQLDARPAVATAILNPAPLTADLHDKLKAMISGEANRRGHIGPALDGHVAEAWEPRPHQARGAEGQGSEDPRRKLLLELLPEATVFEDAFHTGAAQLHVDRSGLILRAVMPLAPRD